MQEKVRKISVDLTDNIKQHLGQWDNVYMFSFRSEHFGLKSLAWKKTDLTGSVLQPSDNRWTDNILTTFSIGSIMLEIPWTVTNLSVSVVTRNYFVLNVIRTQYAMPFVQLYIIVCSVLSGYKRSGIAIRDKVKVVLLNRARLDRGGGGGGGGVRTAEENADRATTLRAVDETWNTNKAKRRRTSLAEGERNTGCLTKDDSPPRMLIFSVASCFTISRIYNFDTYCECNNGRVLLTTSYYTITLFLLDICQNNYNT